MTTIEFLLAFLMFITPVNPRCNVAAIANEYRPRTINVTREPLADRDPALGLLLEGLTLRTADL